MWSQYETCHITDRQTAISNSSYGTQSCLFKYFKQYDSTTFKWVCLI